MNSVKGLILGVLGIAALVLAGCAGDMTDGAYPKMSDFTTITKKVLTPQEQEKEIQSMSSEQQTQYQKAVKEIEKR